MPEAEITSEDEIDALRRELAEVRAARRRLRRAIGTTPISLGYGCATDLCRGQ
jgi:hypothetical protein